MTDVAAPPAFQSLAEIAVPARRRNNKEWRLQSYADRLIDRIVLQPCFTSGIDHASNTSDNARARARGRGVKSGLPDIYVVQGAPRRAVWIELKRGSSISGAQLVVHAQLRACDERVYVCASLEAVHVALMGAGFRLHGNAANIAQEMEARLGAADDKAAAPRSVSSRSAASRKGAATRSQIKQHAARIGRARLGL